jgi:hypothetical protein
MMTKVERCLDHLPNLGRRSRGLGYIDSMHKKSIPPHCNKVLTAFVVRRQPSVGTISKYVDRPRAAHRLHRTTKQKA